ncbi:hypothetical protein NDN08_003319 [Rhodosorus marinus]|uniref:Right handed beta helix domain-containing protein n=1 Tax=Rhodosorus marinus TaxID=101924 RepID=A0AAV8V098_9RHOD|nr:hypothetical protein NDN08_003319 [Rhodosorus marinus]
MKRPGVLVVLVGLWLICGSHGKAIVLKCGSSLREEIEKADKYDILVSNGGCKWEVSKAIIINKPLTLKGIHVTLQSGVVGSIFSLRSNRITISDFTVIGNRDSVTKGQSLINAYRSGFVIENGALKSSSSHGIRVAPVSGGLEIDGGVIRDVVGHRNIGNVVLLSTSRGGKTSTRNVLVENVRAYDSKFKGALEVSNGVQDIFAQTLYAERCVFAFAVQDQSLNQQSIRRVFLTSVVARKCDYGVLSKGGVRHYDISISGVIIENCKTAMTLHNLNWGRVYDVRVIDAGDGKPQIGILKSDNLTLRDVSFMGKSQSGSAVLIRESNKVRVSGVMLSETTSFTCGILFFETSQSKLITADISGIDLGAAQEDVRGIEYKGD